ncbi:MAG: hypothetical protein RL398_328 [Planctomycetota bacterium]|jgi:hypothetical protein
MKTRFAAALFALALPLCAQAPVSAETEAIFYKAFYLEKGPRDFAQAMTLYEQFLAKAPEHKLAAEAARQQFGLLDRLGKTKERDAFKEKYGKLIGDVAAAPRAQRPEPGADAADGDRPARPGQAGGAGGPGGPGQRGQRGMGVMGGKPLAEMNEEELGQFKAGLERMETMMERMRQNMTEEQQKALDANLDSLKKSLEAGKLEDAQKALDGLRSSFPQRRRGGEGGDAGGQGGPGGGQGRRQGGGEGGGEGGEGARPAQGRRGGGGGGGGN